MINGSAGGHTFKNGRCDCGRELVDIQWVTMDDVGQKGIAHAGEANSYEIEQIMKLAAEMRDRFK